MKFTASLLAGLAIASANARTLSDYQYDDALEEAYDNNSDYVPYHESPSYGRGHNAKWVDDEEINN